MLAWPIMLENLRGGLRQRLALQQNQLVAKARGFNGCNRRSVVARRHRGSGAWPRAGASFVHAASAGRCLNRAASALWTPKRFRTPARCRHRRERQSPSHCPSNFDVLPFSRASAQLVGFFALRPWMASAGTATSAPRSRRGLRQCRCQGRTSDVVVSVVARLDFKDQRQSRCSRTSCEQACSAESVTQLRRSAAWSKRPVRRTRSFK